MTQDNKHTTKPKEADHKQLQKTKENIDNTGKKVNRERSKHDTDEKVKNKVTGANQGAPPY